MRDLTPAQMSLVRRTVASDCNDSEFDLYMAAAKSYGLDPFRKQIIPLVFSKNNPEKRRMSIVVARDGLRVIAQRCGDYRPASEKAEVERDEAAVNETNPKGLVSVTVRLFKQDNRGEWYPVIGEALWDEFVPVVEEWAYDQVAGRRKPTGKQTVEGNWAKMPVVMLTKCAEAQALRAGWPDQFGGLYDEAEMDQAIAAELSASEAVEAESARRREEIASVGKSTLMTFSGGVLDRVPYGEVYDRAMEHIARLEPPEIHAWSIQNREGLKEFWAHSPNDALALKKEIEARTAKLGAAA